MWKQLVPLLLTLVAHESARGQQLAPAYGAGEEWEKLVGSKSGTSTL